MTNHARLYRFGLTPWERYGTAAAGDFSAVLGRERAARRGHPGRALDLGCGRGQFTPELANRGWETIGVDVVPAAVAAANSRRVAGVSYVVGDVTALPSQGSGTFDFFLDVGCFQGLDGAQRKAAGRGVRDLANPGATLLMLAFGPSRCRSFIGGVSRDDVEAALPGWELLADEPAPTAGLGWPMNRTDPRWYRMRRGA